MSAGLLTRSQHYCVQRLHWEHSIFTPLPYAWVGLGGAEWWREGRGGEHSGGEEEEEVEVVVEGRWCRLMAEDETQNRGRATKVNIRKTSQWSRDWRLRWAKGTEGGKKWDKRQRGRESPDALFSSYTDSRSSALWGITITHTHTRTNTHSHTQASTQTEWENSLGT